MANLRLWPGISLAAIVLIVRFVLPRLVPSTSFFGAIAGVLLGLLVVLWWFFASRAPARERWAAAGAIGVSMLLVPFLLDPTIGKSSYGMLYFLYALPLVGIALPVWAVVSGGWSPATRRTTLVATVLAIGGVFLLLRSSGLYGSGYSEFEWRWSATAEDRLIADAGDVQATGRAVATAEIHWPGFRGFGRDSVLRGTNIATDWQTSPPVELWRRPVGPGWSSFAVAGDVLYTQEQRGEDELVSAYRVSTGEPVWTHSNTTRFWEAMGGPGPRATPTLDGGRLYVVGANGLFNVLDAATGERVWSRDLTADTGATVPIWGFSGSPLVLEDRVVVTASGVMAAYGLETGEPLWTGVGTLEGEAYTSPQPMTLGGIEQVVLVSPQGAAGIFAGNGSVIWQHAWEGGPIVQPAATADGGLLISVAGPSGGAGVRKLSVGHGPTGWSIDEVWTSNRLKPYFNDLVVHEGHAYGFDGAILAAIDLETGQRAWKGGRYGHGQLLLLADQDLLLVLSEQGDLVLVSATPGEHQEIAKVPALDGKTWNHPVLVGDVLLVRNAEEMAAFRLAQGG